MTFTPCTINGKSCEINDSPTTFAKAFAAIDSVDTVQFRFPPSEPNCVVMLNNFILINTCIYEYRPV